MSMYKTKKAAELRKLSSEQLKKRIQDINATQMQLKSLQITSGAMNPGQWRNVKREKARILTILGERSRMENGKQMGGFRKR